MHKKSNYPTGQVSPTYTAMKLPLLHRYDLSSNRGWLRWEKAMRATNVFISTDIMGMLAEALDSTASRHKQIYVDSYLSYLKDLYKINQIKEPLDRWLEKNNIWEQTTIIDRDWREKRFVRIAHESEFEKVAHSRDIFIYSDETKEKIRNSIIATAGAGVGGMTTYLWALTGGKYFRIADPGELGPHKLNRFIGGDIGDVSINQAILLTQMIYEANPYAEIVCEPKGLQTVKDIQDFYKGATIGIEAMDNLPLKAQAREVMEELHVPYVMPTDLNREGFVGFNDQVLKRFTPKLRKKLMQADNDQKIITDLAIDVFIGPHAPIDMLTPLHQANKAGLPFWPQSGLAAFASAAGAVFTMIKYLEGDTSFPSERPIRLH